MITGEKVSPAQCSVSVLWCPLVMLMHSYALYFTECQEFPSCPVHSVGLLEYYKLQDGIDLLWFPHTNTQEQLTQAVTGTVPIYFN